MSNWVVVSMVLGVAAVGCTSGSASTAGTKLEASRADPGVGADRSPIGPGCEVERLYRGDCERRARIDEGGHHVGR